MIRVFIPKIKSVKGLKQKRLAKQVFFCGVNALIGAYQAVQRILILDGCQRWCLLSRRL